MNHSSGSKHFIVGKRYVALGHTAVILDLISINYVAWMMQPPAYMMTFKTLF